MKKIIFKLIALAIVTTAIQAHGGQKYVCKTGEEYALTLTITDKDTSKATRVGGNKWVSIQNDEGENLAYFSATTFVDKYFDESSYKMGYLIETVFEDKLDIETMVFNYFWKCLRCSVFPYGYHPKHSVELKTKQGELQFSCQASE